LVLIENCDQSILPVLVAMPELPALYQAHDAGLDVLAVALKRCVIIVVASWTCLPSLVDDRRTNPAGGF
jgi:hypothetical protein